MHNNFHGKLRQKQGEKEVTKISEFFSLKVKPKMLA